MNTKISLTKKLQIGLPLTEPYFKPTPKFFKILGDALMTLGTLGTAISIKNPTVAVICAVSGYLGKFILKCISEK